jgi:adenylosuccinate lyase
MPFDHSSYISPFSWRYGSQPMRKIWSEDHKRHLMRRVWVALAKAQNQAGLVSAEQLADLQKYVDKVDIERSSEIESQIHHDVMAELKTFAEQCSLGGGILHLGATSADITDNVDILRIKESIELVMRVLLQTLILFAQKIEETASVPIMAFTHIQPAEPTTLGYRFSIYAQDLYHDFGDLRRLREDLRGKGFKGAVGTQASFEQLLQGSEMSPAKMEEIAMAELGLPYYQITTQTYPRGQDFRIISALAGIAASLHKFALDLRILQSPAIGELSERFDKRQVGSSAMPFKRNPVNAENICSLARYLASLPSIAWGNASQSILERSLDDSANRRIFLAEGFLATDELLHRASRLLFGVSINYSAIEENLDRNGYTAATGKLMLALVRAGANRQEVHEWIRQISVESSYAVREGKDDPLVELLAKDERINDYLSADVVRDLITLQISTGTASQRALAFAELLRAEMPSD